MLPLFIMKLEEEIKQQKFKSPVQKALLNIIYTANWLQNKQVAYFKTYGITPTQFNILRILRGQHPNSISATEIKSRMLDKNSDVSRLLDRLTAKNLVAKQTCPEDRRAFNVFITNEGLSLLTSMDESVDENILSLTEDQAKELSRLLDLARD